MGSEPHELRCSEGGALKKQKLKKKGYGVNRNPLIFWCRRLESNQHTLASTRT
jgi:hypothetical protein